METMEPQLRSSTRRTQSVGVPDRRISPSRNSRIPPLKHFMQGRDLPLAMVGPLTEGDHLA